jgi:hypothetical protein
MSEQVDQKQRVLKIIVIVLGILIVMALGAIVAGMVMQAHKLDRKKAAAVEKDAAAPPAQAEVLGNVDVPIPYGARVVEVTAGDGELHVLLDMPEGRALLLVDRATGEVMGSLRFVPGSAPAAQPAAP